MTNRGPKIVVIGSINRDLVVRCTALPKPGETVLARSSVEVCGGKGANQALAAAMAGGDVTMVGRVGDDAFADRMQENLGNAQIQTEYVRRMSEMASGVAIVAVEDSGENSIIVVPGANGHVGVSDVEEARAVIESSEIVLLQLEIPIETVLAAIRLAKSAGVRVIVDPAPAPDQWPDEIFDVDLLCPNTSEAASVVGHPVESIDDAVTASRAIHAMGAANVAITMGDRGTLLFDGKEVRTIAPFSVRAVDSTAAGDAFAGTVAVHWAQFDNLVAAVRFGNAAGALAASRAGAQPSLASRNEIETLCKSASVTNDQSQQHGQND